MEQSITQLATPLRVLIVDDSRAIQAITRRTVAQCGFHPVEIQTASSGDEAMAIVSKQRIDLIITDWHMPQVSGLEMLQTLRQRGHRNVLVGFVTTERNPALMTEALQNGAAFIVHKPFEDAELIAKVRDKLRHVVKHRALPPEPLASPAENVDPVPFAAMQYALSRKLGNIPFRLVQHEKLTAARMAPSNLLGLYSLSGKKGVYAIGLMDFNAVCLIGGGSARLAPTDVRAALQQDTPDGLLLDKARDFLSGLAETIQKTVKAPSALSLTQSNMVKGSVGRLTEVIEQGENRSDFRLSIPGYGEGRVAFFLLTA